MTAKCAVPKFTKRYAPQLLLAGCALACLPAQAKVSGYIPMSDWQTNALINQLYAIKGVGQLKRPYAINRVRREIRAIWESHPELKAQLEARLANYDADYGVSQLQLTAAGTSGEGPPTINNGYGEAFDSSYAVEASVFWQPSDYIRIQGGGAFFDQLANTKTQFIPNNSYISLGFDSFQIDIGYRERWLSAFQSHSTLLSNNSATMPSISISNITPFDSFANFRYDVALQRMTYQENIKIGSNFTAGNPVLLSTQFSIEPLNGWTIAAARTMQFGGGDREVSVGTVFRAFIDPVSNDNRYAEDFVGCAEAQLSACELGNQLASISSKLVFDGDIPVVLYMEYAGEDTAGESATQLGNIVLSAGFDAPYIKLGNYVTGITLELSDWQNLIYFHDIYSEGYRNHLVSMGHWMDNHRPREEGIPSAPGSSVYIGNQWYFNSKSLLNISYRYINLKPNRRSQDYLASGNELSVRWHSEVFDIGYSIGLIAGSSTFGEDYTRVSLSFNL